MPPMRPRSPARAAGRPGVALALLLTALAFPAPTLAQTADPAAFAAELRREGLRIREAERAALPADAPDPDAISPRFDLLTSTGERLSAADLKGRPYALFFGYVADQSICSVVLPRIGGAMYMLQDAGIDLVPIIVTIDPQRDTPQAMAGALPRYHEKLIGLTGTPAQLEAVRDAFHVVLEKAAELPDGSPVYIHGSYVYLVGAEGEVLTLLPPLMSPARMAQVFASYL